MVLYVFYLCILAVSLFVIGRVLYIQYGWKPNPEIAGKLTQPVKPVILEPARGNILSDDGRPLALSSPATRSISTAEPASPNSPS